MTRKAYRDIAFIILVIAIAFFPLWSFIFSLKNDFFTQYFLQRFFIGQSIYNLHLPLWNPYLNYGIPVFNDMNSGFWYPLTWFNGLLTGYTAYSFTIEEFIHFPIAAIAIYKLCGYFKLGQTARLAAAISYACCGYFIAHTQHYNWITGAAWLPWCLLLLYRCIDVLSIKNVCAGVLIFGFFISGTHPGMIIGGLYFFLFMTIIHIIAHKNQWMKSARNLSVLVSLIIISMAGLIYSYAEIIPLFTRSGKISTGEIAVFSTPLTSFFSFFLPLPFTKTGGEITMNNLYIGLLMVVCVVAGIIRVRKKQDFYLLVVGGFFLMISTNTPLSLWIIEKLPLLQYVRLNGEFRIFGMLALVLYGAIQFDNLLTHHIKFLRNVVLTFCILLTLTGVYSLITQPTSFHLTWPANREALKNIIHGIGFWQSLIGQSFWQSFVLLILALTIAKKSPWIKWVVAADLIATTLLNLPFTGLSMQPVAGVQAMVNKSPKGFPPPSLEPEKDLYTIYPSTNNIIGNQVFYSKQIAVNNWYPYPILLQSSAKYFEDIHQSQKQDNKGFIFSNDSTTVLRISYFTPSAIHLQADVLKDDRLVIKQNLYPGWKTSLNNTRVNPDTAYYAFPAINIKKGHNEISHEFRKPLVAWLFAFYWIMLIALSVTLLRYYKKSW